jgi:hypothetical protein
MCPPVGSRRNAPAHDDPLKKVHRVETIALRPGIALAGHLVRTQSVGWHECCSPWDTAINRPQDDRRDHRHDIRTAPIPRQPGSQPLRSCCLRAASARRNRSNRLAGTMPHDGMAPAGGGAPASARIQQPRCNRPRPNTRCRGTSQDRRQLPDGTTFERSRRRDIFDLLQAIGACEDIEPVFRTHASCAALPGSAHQSPGTAIDAVRKNREPADRWDRSALNLLVRDGLPRTSFSIIPHHHDRKNGRSRPGPNRSW